MQRNWLWYVRCTHSEHASAALCVELLPVNLRAIRAQVWKRTAEAMSAAGQMDEATAAMRQACRLMPGERTYHVMLAASIVMLRRPEVERAAAWDPVFAH